MGPSNDQAPETPAPEVSDPPRNPALRPWQVYLFALATFGLYLPYWTWRHSRRATADDGSRATPYLWALGSLMPPVAWAILYDLGREALDSRPRGGRRMPAGVPAALCLLISILGIIGPLQAMMIGWLALVPLPFALVQGMINASAIEEVSRPRRSRALRAALGVATTFGLALFAGAVYVIDGGEISRLGRGRITAGSVVSGVAAAYELRVHSPGWHQLSAGMHGDDEADLELGGPGQLTWVVVYVEDSRVYGIDESVSNRRGLVFSSGEPAGFEERRYFLDEESFAPVSVVDYRVDFPFAPPDHYVVLTTEIRGALIEVIGYTGEPHHLEELRDLVLSFRSAEQERSDL